eukprot:Skav223106  [mRNA]  locus=scaffold419:714693:717699:+ [translate_table: standard]
MVVTAVLWQYWQEQQYEEAITEVCASLDIKEEEVSSFNGDQELLAAAGDTQPLGFHWSPDKENLALFGCSCCNRLTEKHLRSDWRVAAHWCALARHLEGDASTASAGRWALARFHRLFNAAEAIRVAGNAESDARKQHFLEASQRCLRACEAMWLRPGPPRWARHSRIMKRLQRQGQVVASLAAPPPAESKVPMAPLGLAEAQLELGRLASKKLQLELELELFI